MTKSCGVYLYFIYIWPINLHFYKIYFSCQDPEFLVEIYFDCKYFLGLIRLSGVLVPEKKDCYFSTIRGFSAIVPLYVDVFLRL